MKYFIGDLHFGHEKLLSTPAWKQFSSIEDHDSQIIKNWNSRVTPEDTVFLLGDVALGGTKKDENFMKSRFLQGHKRLILGNHDASCLQMWAAVFDSVHGAYCLDNQNWLLTHLPVHPCQMQHRYSLNIHGHMHSTKIDDKKYLNVSCEQINFTPISLIDIKNMIDSYSGSNSEGKPIC